MRKEPVDAVLAKESWRMGSRHVPGGTYYVVRRSGRFGRAIFRDALDYAAFERLLALALVRYRCRLHAFRWERDSIHLAVQVNDRPVGRFLRWLCGWYERSMSKGAVEEMLFEQSYRAMLIGPGEALLSLIQYLHLRPVGAGAALSSHHAYLGVVHIPWLTTSVALGMLAPSLEQGRIEYRGMMERLENNPATLFVDVERYRERRPALSDFRSPRERNVDPLQIRAVPARLEKDSRF
jgi:hypothetical protein